VTDKRVDIRGFSVLKKTANLKKTNGANKSPLNILDGQRGSVFHH
jgi:hypothetical protein